MASAAITQLSAYTSRLQGVAKSRYTEKIALLNGVDPFVLANSRAVERNSAVPSQSRAAAATMAAMMNPDGPDGRATFPPVQAADLVSYLVLQTSFATAKQFKAHKSMEAYNQFVSGWVKDVAVWTVNQKAVVTSRVSSLTTKFTMHTLSQAYELI